MQALPILLPSYWDHPSCHGAALVPPLHVTPQRDGKSEDTLNHCTTTPLHHLLLLIVTLSHLTFMRQAHTLNHLVAVSELLVLLVAMTWWATLVPFLG